MLQLEGAQRAVLVVVREYINIMCYSDTIVGITYKCGTYMTSLWVFNSVSGTTDIGLLTILG